MHQHARALQGHAWMMGAVTQPVVHYPTLSIALTVEQRDRERREEGEQPLLYCCLVHLAQGKLHEFEDQLTCSQTGIINRTAFQMLVDRRNGGGAGGGGGGRWGGTRHQA